MIKIQGIKTVLRDWQLADLGSYGHWLRPGHQWRNFDSPYYPGPSAADIPNIVIRARANIEAGCLSIPRLNLAVADHQTDELIGMVNWYWISKETNWLAMGIVIYNPKQWGQGIAYEALGLWCEYLWRELPTIVRLELRTWSGNHGMMRLAHKLGFLEESRFRKARIVNAAYYDAMGYGILRDEWAQRYPAGFAAHLVQ
ncbi:MAG: GNAT family N-acetyltransferase [Gammaproteobacteria bacterium]